MVTLLATAGKTASPIPQLKSKDFQQGEFGAFKMKELQSSNVNDYLLSFVSFAKFPS